MGGGGAVIGEDLVHAQHDVGEEQRRLDRVAAPAADAPRAQDHGRGDRDADQDGVDVVELRELRDAPEEVDGARDGGGREDKEGDLDGAFVSIAILRAK